jgi:uncharacterized protein (DUF1501 family)
MLELSRRDFIKLLGSAGLGVPLALGSVRQLAFGADAKPGLLVVIHLRGGCDGLHLISPSNVPEFIEARASDLRVLADGPNAGFPLGEGLDPQIDFRLHAAAKGLYELYQSRDLAFIHASGLLDATRSHFVATDMMELGVSDQAALGKTTSGWIARALRSRQGMDGALDAVSVSSVLAQDLLGLNQTLAIPDLQAGLGIAGGQKVATILEQLYGLAQDEVSLAGHKALQLSAMIDRLLPRDEKGKVLPYLPQDDSQYEGVGGFAQTLKSTAQLIKMNIGLKAITLDYGAWDTHEHQAGRFKGQLEPLSNGLSAFWNDISDYHASTTVVLLTEFGRRLRSNKSGGTDHGRAGVMAVLGGGVKGGRLYGRWPGLKTEQLAEGVDLAVTTDYRSVLAEILQHRFAVSVGSVFQGIEAHASSGLFKPGLSAPFPTTGNAAY